MEFVMSCAGALLAIVLLLLLLPRPMPGSPRPALSHVSGFFRSVSGVWDGGGATPPTCRHHQQPSSMRALSHAWRVRKCIRRRSGADTLRFRSGDRAHPSQQSDSVNAMHTLVILSRRAGASVRGRRLTCNLQKWLREQAEQRNI